MDIVKVDENTVVIDGAFYKAFRRKSVVCGVKYSVELFPRNVFNIVDRIFLKNIYTVADGNSAVGEVFIRIVCHLI